jgi:hypothetical protein
LGGQVAPGFGDALGVCRASQRQNTGQAGDKHASQRARRMTPGIVDEGQ